MCRNSVLKSMLLHSVQRDILGTLEYHVGKRLSRGSAEKLALERIVSAALLGLIGFFVSALISATFLWNSLISSEFNSLLRKLACWIKNMMLTVFLFINL